MQANMIRKIAETDPTKLQTNQSLFILYRRLLQYVIQHPWLLLGAGLSIAGLSVLKVLTPQVTRYVIDELIPQAKLEQLPWVAGIVIAISLGLGLLNYVRTYAISLVGQRTIYTIRQDLYQHLQRLSLGYFETQRTGALMARLTQDVDSLETLITSDAVEVVADGLTFVVVVSYLFYADWRLTVMILLTLPLIILLTRFFGNQMRSAYREAREQGAEVNNHLQETLSNMKVIKACANEGYEVDRFSERNQENLTAKVRVAQLGSAFSPVIEFMNNLGFVIVLVYGAWEVMRGEITVGELTAFIAYLGLVNQPAKKLSKLLTTIQKAATSCERIFETLDTEPEVKEKSDAVTLPPIEGTLQFETVSFAYSTSNQVLENFSLTVSTGETVALVGASGAGKSTIANLAVRFYDPQEGRITLDGYDLRDVTFNSLRRQIGIVSQETLLIYGTVWDNIAYGKPGVDHSAIEAAAKMANAHQFISELPQGYDTVIGERGVKLSGGQRQRLAIARALVKDPRLLILDEATSSLDTESESLIQEALEKLMRDRSSLVIAHRLSTVQNADRIVVIEAGKIIEQGSHSELMQQRDRYYQLYQRQFPKQQPTYDPPFAPL